MSHTFELLSEKGFFPTASTAGAAGYDLKSPIDCVVEAHGVIVIPLDIRIIMNRGRVAKIESRSGLASKFDITVRAGIIDSDYTGNVSVVLKNGRDTPFGIKRGDRIAQLLIYMIDMPTQVVEGARDRGIKGFGSTGGFGVAKKYIAIEGVACNFKTSSLQRLAETKPGVALVYNDYAEFCHNHGDHAEENYIFKQLPEFKTIYTMWVAMQGYKTNAVYDRFPGSSLIYSLIFRDAQPSEYKLVFDAMVTLKFVDPWDIVVVLPFEGQQKKVVASMVKRNNKIDVLNTKYVNDQMKAFKMFADYFNLPVVYVTHDDPEMSIELICKQVGLMLERQQTHV
ncbi:Ld138-like protein [Hyphantria cunea granulovirus]|uniref:dUTP diphosphatase n=1 Tax=Hyphantria cunea granulovirus TaxID=307448 RepID=A0AAF1D275_9BBAC|nr:Ld138-like protein [Hyphantria cunea granulovirus]QBQ01603.1 Ld138-like protein [Hyphantria cunea granulovirus]